MSIQMSTIVKFQVHDSKSPCQVILVSNVRLTSINRLDASVVIVVASLGVANVGLVVIIIISPTATIVVTNPSVNVATFSCKSLLIARPIVFVSLVITQTMPC